jgi:glycosyltransferase involved in cell wall biosynthesis
MSRFAAAGHRVFFVSQFTRREGPAWAATLKAPNVYEVTFREKQLFASLEALRRDVSVEAAAMIVQLPSWWPLAREARERFGWPVIYDCMDFHAGFSTVRKAIVADEDALLAEADAVIASSALLEQNARKHRDDVLLLRNACDFEHFAKTPRSANARPVIGYYGAIADWFDSQLVADLATRRPEWDFVLVGSPYLGDLSRLARLPNVSLPGEQPYASIPEWLGRFDVAIIPFRRTKLTEATNPVKVYEMLAAGKPIVSVPIPEVAALAPLVRLASTADEFEREIAAAIAEDDDDAVERRRAFAREQTWEQRFDTFSAFLSRLRVFA